MKKENEADEWPAWSEDRVDKFMVLLEYWARARIKGYWRAVDDSDQRLREFLVGGDPDLPR